MVDIILQPTNSVVDFELPVGKHAVQRPYILAIHVTKCDDFTMFANIC